MEYHGIQHFKPVAIFGGVAGLEATKERGLRKQRLCVENGVKLIIATPDSSHQAIIERVLQVRSPGLTQGEASGGMGGRV